MGLKLLGPPRRYWTGSQARIFFQRRRVGRVSGCQSRFHRIHRVRMVSIRVNFCADLRRGFKVSKLFYCFDCLTPLRVG
jgi:hypothetical protein